MALLDHQKLTWVLPGKPFGDGRDGAYSSATIPTLTKDSCSGSSTTLTTSGSTFANGDVLMVHQTRGTGVGQWEFALISSGGGSTSLTLSKALQYTYTDSGASQAQAIKLLQYTDCTVGAGTWTVPAWDGNVGGILPFVVNGTLTPTGTISLNGSTGATAYTTSGVSAVTTGGGFRGGYGRQNSSSGRGRQGEGTVADGSESTAANGNGGGGAYGNGSAGSASGGGAGHFAGGSAGTSSELQDGDGGGTAGNADLTNAVFGGGGGGCFSRDGVAQTIASGGSGGGFVVIYANTITSPTLITANGGTGGNGSRYGDGGGGAGGSILICGGTVDIGTDKLSTLAGVGGSNRGGNGSKGRIAIYYGISLTGSVSSTYYGSLTSEQDTSFISSSRRIFLIS